MHLYRDMGGLHGHAVFPIMERMGNMFGFRIINLPDGTQIIDTTLSTPYDALTPLQMVEYVEMDVQIAIMDRMDRKRKAESGRKRKLARNPLYRLACLCGIA